MERVVTFVFILLSGMAFCQEKGVLRALVVNASSQVPIPNVNIVNLDKVTGTITDDGGFFEIKAVANDTIFMSYLGFKSVKVKVTNDMLKFGPAKIEMTELAYALEKIEVKPYKLTGYLDIDIKHIPISPVYQYSISGLPSIGYEAGGSSPDAISKIISAVFNPADFMYNMFSKRSKQFRKLKKMRQEDQVRNLLASKFDRETLVQFLQIDKKDLETILRHCNYSDAYIKEANDLQILEAISGCYEEYRSLNTK